MRYRGIVLVVLMTLLAASLSQAKDYYFPEVRVEIAVQKDGGFFVDEYRTFEFEGHFSYAYIVIPLRVDRPGHRYDIRLSGFSVTDEHGRPLEVEESTSGGRFTGRWEFSADDGRRTFHIHYRVDGGIMSYPDVTELYWQAVGDEWEKPAGAVRVDVRLPEEVSPPSGLMIWGHGPLSGESKILDARTARFTVSNLPSRQYVEIRVVWPAGMVAGVPSDSLSLPAIRAEEDRYVRETIERVGRAKERQARSRARFLKLLGVWGVWQVLGPILWLVLFFRVWSRVGKDYRFEGLSDYTREPPSDLPPAFVQVLMREGRDVTPAAFTATIFDLARRGFLRMEDIRVEKRTIFGSRDKPDTRVTLSRAYEDDPDLRPFERDVLDYLFEGAGPGVDFLLGGFKERLKKNPRAFQTWYRAWVKQVRLEAKARGFLEPESVLARNAFLAGSIPIGLLTLSPVLLLLSAFLIPTLKRRTRPWARENEMWRGLERFLDDFSDFAELPPQALTLWEQYLVFGILFGNAKKILKVLPAILKDERAAVPVWYSGVSPGAFASAGGLSSMISSIEHTATTISQASTSAAHYSSGGGGGFSGGGGGGGGAG